MESYSATYVEAERALLASKMSFTALAILRYLVSRADPLGRCWPSQERIAEDMGGLRRETVGRHLSTLEEAGLIGYLRREGRDPITGQHLCNVYMVSPFYIALRPELQAEAEALWSQAHVIVQSHGHVTQMSHKPTTEPQTGTSDRKQRQEPTTTTTDDTDENAQGENPQPVEKSKDKKQAQRAQKQRAKSETIAAENSTPQQATEKSKGSAPIVKNSTIKYPELAPVSDALDPIAERLAVRVRDEAMIPLPLARCLIKNYAGAAVEGVLNSGALKDAERPGGLLRYLLHTRSVTSAADAPVPQQENSKSYASGKYAEFIES